MLLWLNALPGVANGMQMNAVDHLIASYRNNEITIRNFLDEQEFVTQLKNLNHNVLEFVYRERKHICKEFIAVITDRCEECTDNNYKQYILHPMVVLEIMALDVPPLMNAFFEDLLSDELFTQLFAMLDRQDEIPEPQMGNFVKFLQPLIARNMSRVCQFAFSRVVSKCAHHLYSGQMTNFLIIMFNPESSSRLMEQQQIQDTKVALLKSCMVRLDQMRGPDVLNFMILVHEVMTRYQSMDKSNDVMNYVVSQEFIDKLFLTLSANDNIYTSKAVAHILSLISNYYSYSMQNITIIEDPTSTHITDYHMQLSQQFETSAFYKAFTSNLSIFVTLLSQVRKGKIGVLTFKIIEITDNLIRISNLPLWKQMSSVSLFQAIIRIYFEFQNSSIIHTITEKMILYILNRTISDFHPFWAYQLFVEMSIMQTFSDYINKHRAHGHIIQMINHLNQFHQEVLNMNYTLKYAAQVQDIMQVFSSRAWQNCKQAQLAALEAEKNTEKAVAQIEAQEQTFETFGESSKLNVFQSAKTNYIEGQSMQTQGDDSLMDEDDEINDELSVLPKNEPENLTKQEQVETQDEILEETTHDYINQSDSKSDQKSELKQEATKQDLLSVGNENATPVVEVSSKNQEEVLDTKIKDNLHQNIISPQFEMQIESDAKDLATDQVKIQIEKNEIPISQLQSEVQTTVTNTPANKKDEIDETKSNPQRTKSIDMDKPLLISYYGVGTPFTRSQSSDSSPSPLMQRKVSLDGSPRDEMPPDLNFRKRSSAMESSLKLKSMGEDAFGEFQIVSTLNDLQEDRVIVQPGNHRVLKVDELDSERTQTKDLSMSQSFDMSSLRNSVDSNSKRLILKFSESMIDKKKHLKIIDPMVQSMQSMHERQSVNSLSDSFMSFNSLDEKRFRKISSQDKKFLTFLSRIKVHKEVINEELQ